MRTQQPSKRKGDAYTHPYDSTQEAPIEYCQASSTTLIMTIRRPTSLTGLVLFSLFAAFLVQPTSFAAAQQQCFSFQTKAEISITFDDFPPEISWEIVDSFSRSVVCSRYYANEGFSGGQTVLDICCLDHRYWEETPKEKDGGDGDSASMDDRRLQPSGREYTFTISDSFGDGMCCSHGQGRFAVSIGGKIMVDGRSNKAAAFGSLASSAFVVGSGSTPSSTPSPTPWSTPYPTVTITTDTLEPSDEVTMYPAGTPAYYYDCPPTSAMGSRGFSSEFNGCITPSGCQFLATPYWDNGSFEEEACWYCCSSLGDTCGVCSGCECGYGQSATPAPSSMFSMDVATYMPTYGHPPLGDNFSPDKASRLIWSDASQGIYPWSIELECIPHPALQYGHFEKLVQSMIRALGDIRLNWEIEPEIRFGSTEYWMDMRFNDDDEPPCWTLVSLARFIEQTNDGFVTRHFSDELRYKLGRATDAFVERANKLEEGKDSPERFVVLLVLGILFFCGISLGCICCFCYRLARKSSEEDRAAARNGGSGVSNSTAVAGSLVSSATILPSIAEVPPIPVASAVPKSGSRDVENIALSPLAKIVGVENTCKNNAVPQPSAPPAPPSAPPKYTETEEDIGLAAGESLAACLSEAGSFGRTEAIADWMRDSSQLASFFSPEDMAQALSAVSFSLDQPLAAKEIAAGFGKNGGRITCDHVVGALGVCDRSARLEVARGMAPFVSDLVNEATILSLFESSCEREQVDRALHAYSNELIHQTI